MDDFLALRQYLLANRRIAEGNGRGAEESWSNKCHAGLSTDRDGLGQCLFGFDPAVFLHEAASLLVHDVGFEPLISDGLGYLPSLG